MQDLYYQQYYRLLLTVWAAVPKVSGLRFEARVFITRNPPSPKSFHQGTKGETLKGALGVL